MRFGIYMDGFNTAANLFIAIKDYQDGHYGWFTTHVIICVFCMALAYVKTKISS